LIPPVLVNPGVASECATAESTLLTPFGKPLPPLPCRFDPRAFRCRKGASRDWCRWGGFADGERNDQFSGGVGRWFRLFGVLGGLGSTRASRFSQIARWEWCNSVRCASANGPCVQECDSISVIPRNLVIPRLQGPYEQIPKSIACVDLRRSSNSVSNKYDLAPCVRGHGRISEAPVSCLIRFSEFKVHVGCLRDRVHL
jgi:hypothetical protein